MENENKEIKDSQNPADEFSTLRAVAKLKAKPKGFKSRHTITTTETIKVATAFGATTQEIQVEKPVESLTAEQHEANVKTAHDDALIEGTTVINQEDGSKTIVSLTPEEAEKAKELRDKLASMWSTDASQTDPNADRYIEGVPTGNVVHNPDSGHSGVRMSFKSKK